MQTIEAYEKDILLQIKFLKKIKLERTLSETAQKNTIFCGTGDSFVASLLAEAISNYTTRAVDPLDLLKNKLISKKKTVYLISISGNTITNINVAKKTRKSIAITSNPKSLLSKTCSKTIHLKYPDSKVFTAGSIGFLASALTCISLVKSFNIKGISNIFRRAITISKKINIGKRVFIIGNYYTYPIAMYAAAKFSEVLGIDVHYERIEQFLHMGLFCVNRGDTVIIFENKNPHTISLSTNLKKAGIRVVQPTLVTNNQISEILFFIFVGQLIPLFLAKKNHQKECYFVTAKNLRVASSNMIY
ncbi:MAG: putative phosphosugar isomerase [Nitrosopumilales archaeon]|nr:MAG: putative phosphosugar isomerase [Nitrosopumilales archaeon]